MSRKDYILIAAALKQALDEGLIEYNASRETMSVAHIMADKLRHTNPRFDRERFLKACGVAQ